MPSQSFLNDNLSLPNPELNITYLIFISLFIDKKIPLG